MFSGYILVIQCQKMSLSSAAVVQVGKLRHNHIGREVLEAAAPQAVLGPSPWPGEHSSPSSREEECADTRLSGSCQPR